MTAAELLAQLRDLDVTVTTDGAGFDVDGPEEVLTDELLGQIAAHKSGLLTLLTDSAETGGDWRVKTMLDQMAQWPGSGTPFLVARPEARVQFGFCLSCGEPLSPDRSSRCAPCVQAINLALGGE